MQPGSSPIILRSVGLVLAAGLQIWAGNWRLLFRQRTSIGQLDPTTLVIAGIDVLLVFVSGMLIALILFPNPNSGVAPKKAGLAMVLSILLPAIGIGIKLGAAITYVRLPFNTWQYILIFEWAAYSGIPALWLGISSVALIHYLRK